MHLRPPSIDHGITSFVWAFVLGLLLWLFMLGIGISKATSFIVAALVALRDLLVRASLRRGRAAPALVG